VSAPPPVFDRARIEREDQVPPADPRIVDVAVLDMNHGWPNLGHDAVVRAVEDAADAVAEELREADLRVRALSFEVRRAQVVPEHPGARFALYLGTGGPGHLDPRRNDGAAPGSQGLREDPSWEGPLFRLFDAIQAAPEAALLSVCHTFGVMCRWSGAARPVLRGPEKGGKSAGVVDNVLTTAARQHPWFSRLARSLPDGRTLPVIDHRLFDLIQEGPLPTGLTAIGHEAFEPPAQASVTMIEFARDPGGHPRLFGVNHHPEVADHARQWEILRGKLDRGEVSRDWYEDRARILSAIVPDPGREERLRLTSEYTLFGLVRHYVYAQASRRARERGRVLELSAERSVRG
jgi:hypothetical protein